MDNHCSSFAGDIKEIKNQKDALVTASKVSQLLKYSSKKETLFKTLKEELIPGTLGFQTLYQTTWTVQNASLQSVFEKLESFAKTVTKCLETKLDSDIRGRVTGGKYQMKILIFSMVCKRRQVVAQTHTA